MYKITVVIAMALIFTAAGLKPAAAGTTHEGHGTTPTHAPAAESAKAPVAKFEHTMVDNHVRAEFQIMSLASMNMKDPDGATHHIMVKLFHDSMNHEIADAVGKIKVIEPSGKEQTNSLKNYNGIFAANFSFAAAGKYGIICLLKVDGEKHLYKFWYTHE